MPSEALPDNYLVKLQERGLELATINLIRSEVPDANFVSALKQAASWINGRTVIIEQAWEVCGQNLGHRNAQAIANNTFREQIRDIVAHLFRFTNNEIEP